MNDSSTNKEFTEIVLGVPDAVDQTIFHGPGAKLGGVEPDISLKQIRLRIGRRPTIHNMKKLCETLNVEFPKKLSLFEKYDVWLLSFNLSLIKDGGFNSVTKLGFQVKYPEGYDVSIVSQLPDSEFISIAGGQLKAAASFSVVGNAEIPTVGVAAAGASLNIGGGISAEASGDAHVNLSFAVMTSKVVATGTGDYLGEWLIKRSEQPLIGEQQFLSTVLVPKDESELTVEVRSYVAVSTPYLVPARLNSNWVTMKLSLNATADVGTEG